MTRRLSHLTPANVTTTNARRPWSPDEERILNDHAHVAVEVAHAALTAAGHTRTRAAVKSRRRVMGYAAPAVWDVPPLPTPLGTLPAVPARITRQLFALAESNPTPAEYLRRKAEILGEA